MSSSSVKNERVRRLPLSSSMHGLLGSLLTVIDKRVLQFGEAKLWADAGGHDMVPTTCDACCGTGFVLVFTHELDDVADESAKGKEPAKHVCGSMDPVPGYPPSPILAARDEEEMLLYFGVKQPAASDTPGTTSAPVVAPVAPSVAAAEGGCIPCCGN
ncbi:hypothetical protein NMY22_g19809 [Coprinellus aureogranulatus]|nr:hypothetical protein NMY22_g19809 [Coprinellus aureogranulatus]